jgi:hypothetical protein
MRVLPTACCLLLAISSAAGADKIDDFKDADRHDEGCSTIPVTYSSDRSSCQSEGPNVHPWCDGAKGPVTCGSESETKDRKRDVENAKKLIEELKEKKSKSESNRSSAKTDDEKRKYDDEVRQFERDIYDAEKQLDAARQALEARKKHVEDAIYTLDKCIAYRRAVMNAFASALDKMRNENETPDIKTVASSLAKKYEKSKSGHEQQITAKKNAYDNCRDWRP